MHTCTCHAVIYTLACYNYMYVTTCVIKEVVSCYAMFVTTLSHKLSTKREMSMGGFCNVHV